MLPGNAVVYTMTGRELLGYPGLRDSMHRMRKRVFKDELDWDVPVEGDWEIDCYDQDDTVYILYVQDDEVCGTWRLRPTTGEYMLKGEWAAYSKNYLPCDPRAFELSRWAIDKHKVSLRRIEMVCTAMFCAVAEYCLTHGIDELVLLQLISVTSLTNQVFGIPHVRTVPKKLGETRVQVMGYRPNFQSQLRQARELFSFPAPIASHHPEQKPLLAAE